MTPKQLLIGYLCLCGLTLTVATGFLLAGFWIVLPFAGLELLIVALAFVIWGRHATDCEMIEVSPDKLRITVTSGSRVKQIDLAAQWTRIEYHGRFKEPLVFVCKDRRVSLGRFIAEKDKPAVQRELRLALRQMALVG